MADIRISAYPHAKHEGEDLRPAQDHQCHEEPHLKSRRNCKVSLQKDKKTKRQKDKILIRPPSGFTALLT